MDHGNRLYLLRHAKSSWDDPSLRDDERPLAPRGQRAAALLEQHFAASALHVDLVLCSPARRTRQTWARVRAGVQSDPVVRFVPELYGATAEALLAVIRRVDPGVTSVMLVGHNPGIEDLGAGLGGASALLRAGFPTGGFATLTFASPWSELAWAGAELTGFVRPRELTTP